MSWNDDRISVLFACNENYVQHAAACIASLTVNNPGVKFDILVASTQDMPRGVARLEKTFSAVANIRLRTRTCPIPKDIKLPLPYHLTPETYLRFWIGELFPNQSRALYLDPDVVALRPIDELWNTDLDGRTVAAVPIPNSSRPAELGMPKGSPFFNAGVMLFDLDAWRARSYQRRCLDFLAENQEKALDGDQGILNLCLFDDWKVLPHHWNVISMFYYTYHDLKLSAEEVANIQRNAAIVHFNGASKPWSYFSNHPRKDEYWKYLKMTSSRSSSPPTSLSPSLRPPASSASARASWSRPSSCSWTRRRPA